MCRVTHTHERHRRTELGGAGADLGHVAHTSSPTLPARRLEIECTLPGDTKPSPRAVAGELRAAVAAAATVSTSDWRLAPPHVLLPPP